MKSVKLALEKFLQKKICEWKCKCGNEVMDDMDFCMFCNRDKPD